MLYTLWNPWASFSWVVNYDQFSFFIYLQGFPSSLKSIKRLKINFAKLKALYGIEKNSIWFPGAINFFFVFYENAYVNING